MNKKTLYLIVGIVVVIIALFAFNKLLKKEVVEEQTPPVISEEQVEIITVNSLTVPDQAPGDTVFIEETLLKTDGNGGFVVIYRATEDGLPGDVIGVSEYLEPGAKRNFLVSLNLDEAVDIDETVIAILHTDNGDGVWDPETDAPITDDGGNVIMATFVILDSKEDLEGFNTKL